MTAKRRLLLASVVTEGGGDVFLANKSIAKAVAQRWSGSSWPSTRLDSEVRWPGPSLTLPRQATRNDYAAVSRAKGRCQPCDLLVR